MTKEYLNPDELFPSLKFGFSQIVSSSGGKTVYLSGQVGWDQNQEMTLGDDLRAQTYQVLRNIETGMQVAGGCITDIVSMRMYSLEQKLEESSVIQEALKTFFPIGRAPATTWIGVRALANLSFLIEIEAIGVIE